MQIVSAPCVFLDETDNIKTHCSRSQRSDSNAESNAEEKPTSHRWFGGNTPNRYKGCIAKVSDDRLCSHACVHVCLCVHEYAFIHYHECPMVE